MTTITLLKNSKIYEKILTKMIDLHFFSFSFVNQAGSTFPCTDRETGKIRCFTSKEIQEESSTGSSSIEFPDRSHFEMSCDFHTSEGTAVKSSPPKESSCKYNYS